MRKFEEPSPKLHESYRYLDSGDGVEANPPQTRRVCDNRQPECLEAGECAAYHSHRPAAAAAQQQCRSHQAAEAQRCPTRALMSQFTPEMIRDQELLVTSMSQQGIPEALIRRQFDRLIDEQSKQLRLFGESAAKSAAEANPSSSRLRKSSSEDSKLATARKLEPSSLLKIRMKKEELEFQKRNNGLQDPVVAQNILKKCSFKTKARRLEEAGSSTPREQHVRLNGAQDRSDMEGLDLHQQHAAEIRERQRSANGLENARSLQQQQSAREQRLQRLEELPGRRDEEQQLVAAAYEAANSEQQFQAAAAAAATTPRSYNNFTYCPEFQEPRVIGGLTYFARKPQQQQQQQRAAGLLCDNCSCALDHKAASS